MSLFTLDLDPYLRVLLEAHRERLGARSLAQAVRMLIDPPLPLEEVGRIMRDITRRVESGELSIGPVRPKPGSRLKSR